MRERYRESRQNWWYTTAYIAFFLQLAAGMAVSVWFALSNPRTSELETAVVIAEHFSYFAIGATAVTYTLIEGREMWLANRLKEAYREEGRQEGFAEAYAKAYAEGYAKAVEELKQRENGANNKPADREPPESSQ